MYKVLSVVNNVADIVSTDGNISDLPTTQEIGQSGSYTDPSNGDTHVSKLHSDDGTLENRQWVE